MTLPVKVPNAEAERRLRTAVLLTVIIVPLAAIAAAGGIFIPGLYRFTAWLVPATKGQDLVTLLSLPVMLGALPAARRGSAKSTMIWIGILGYICYSYIGAAFAYNFGPFFLLYVALFSLSVFALISAFSSVNLTAIQQQFDAATPHGAVAGFLTVMALLLTLLWFGRIIPNLTANPAPETIEPFKYVFALDLGLIVPLMLLAAIWLRRRVSWGYLLAGCMLVKAATMGLSLLSMNGFNLLAHQPNDPVELLATYGLIAFGSLGMAAWLFRHCRA